MLLKAYERLADPRFGLHLKQHRLRQPTAKQVECLRCLADGLSAGETARRMGVGGQAIVFLRMRAWSVVGSTSLSSALEKVHQLDVLNWTPVDNGSDDPGRVEPIDEQRRNDGKQDAKG